MAEVGEEVDASTSASIFGTKIIRPSSKIVASNIVPVSKFKLRQYHAGMITPRARTPIRRSRNFAFITPLEWSESYINLSTPIEWSDTIMIRGEVKRSILNYCRDESGIGFVELHERSGIPQSSLAKFLPSLVSDGFLEKTPDGKYILTEAGRELLEKERAQSTASRLFSLFTRQVSPKNERIGKYLKGILQLSESAENLVKSPFFLKSDSYVVAYRRLEYSMAAMALSTFILNTGDRLKVKGLREISAQGPVFSLSGEPFIHELEHLPQSIEEQLSNMERDFHNDPEVMAFIDIVRGYTAIMSEAAKDIATAFNK